MRIFSACLVIIFVFLTILARSISANTNYQFKKPTKSQITEALTKTVPIRFLPSHPLYFLISVKETTNRLFQPSAVKRAQFDLVLSGKRLKETYLLFEKNDAKKANYNLGRYSQRVTKMISQLEKARSQNQDVKTLIGTIADDLQSHEILLFAINQKGVSVDDNFDIAISSFTSAV